jgi:hypothetical protein
MPLVFTVLPIATLLRCEAVVMVMVLEVVPLAGQEARDTWDKMRWLLLWLHHKINTLLMM